MLRENRTMGSIPVQLIQSSSDKSLGWAEPSASAVLNCFACCDVSRLNWSSSSAKYQLRLRLTLGKRMSWLVAAKRTERVVGLDFVVIVVMVVSIELQSRKRITRLRLEKPLHAACAFKKFQLITVASKGWVNWISLATQTCRLPPRTSSSLWQHVRDYSFPLSRAFSYFRSILFFVICCIVACTCDANK